MNPRFLILAKCHLFNRIFAFFGLLNFFWDTSGTVAVMYWRGGKIEYEYEPVPTVQEIEARMRAEEARTA